MKMPLSLPALRRLFRFMVIGCWLVTVVTIILSMLLYQHAPQEWLELKQHQGQGSKSWSFMLGIKSSFALFLFTTAMLVLSVSLCIANIGMLFFKRWARTLFLWSLVLYFIGCLISGLQVLLPWESAMLALSYMLAGAIAAMSYYSPLYALFDANGRMDEMPSERSN